MKNFTGFERGMGMGGWLTNYKRFHVIAKEKINILTVGDEEHFQSYITESDIQYIASLGFDHIRLGFDQVVLETENGQCREENYLHIDRFIGWCKKYGLNAVLNLHKALGNYCDVDTGISLFESEALKKRFVALWEKMELRYSKEPNVAFELLNEVKDVPPEEWNSLAERAIQAIRKHNPSRIIIVGSTCWNSPHTLKDLRVFNDENVAYTFHFYEPFEFTHQQGVLQAPTAFYNRKMPYPGDIELYRDYQKCIYNNHNAYARFSRMDKTYIRAALEPVKEFIKQHPDKILWCGEFGNIRHAKAEWRLAWFKDVISFLKENRISYSVWNYLSMPSDGNRFSLVDDETRKLLYPDLHFKDVLLGNF